MALRNWDPFRELLQQQDRVSRLIDEGFGRTAASITMPAIDVYEENGRMVIEALLPNFDQKDIEVNLTDGGLEIKAAHIEEKENKDRKYMLHETTTGSFYRYINLPAGAQMDQAQASFNNGILRVEIPLQDQAQTKKLDIKTGQSK